MDHITVLQGGGPLVILLIASLIGYMFVKVKG
jgi:hypothetical protein